MRSLHIDTGAEMRGGQYQVLLLLGALREAGHEVTLLARLQHPLYEAAITQGLEVHRAEAKEVWSLSQKVEIVHAHDSRAHTLAAIASRRRFVVSRRVLFPVRRSVASHWKYHRATRFLAVSRHVARELEAAGIRRQKIDVVYDAVKTFPAAAAWNASFPAIALASTDPQKGRDLVEEAATLAKVPVVFSRDLLSDFAQASMFIYISRSEGLGSAALLALSMGVPVIASAVGGLTEVIEDGVSGLSVPNHALSIAAAIHRIREERGLAQSLILQGRERVQALFTVERMRDRTIECYRSALAG